MKYLVTLCFLCFGMLAMAQPNTITVKKKPASNDINPKIGRQIGGRIDPTMLIEVGEITVNEDVTVISFDLSAEVNGSSTQLSSMSNKLTPEMIGLIRSLPPDSRLYFDNIFAEDSSGKMAKLYPMRFKISPIDY